MARLNRKQQRQQNIALDMAVYSSDKGVLAQITEERDACGVGFVASMSKKPSHSIVKQVVHPSSSFYLISTQCTAFLIVGTGCMYLHGAQRGKLCG